MDKAQLRGDDGYLDGVALNLHGFYGNFSATFLMRFLKNL